jgi:hypothetical protein
MKRIALSVLVAATVVFVAQASQAPNLSGTWRPTTNPANLRANEPFEVTITQTADSVTMHVPLQTPDVTYKTDGTPGANGTKAVWEGAKLAITSTSTGRGGAPSTTKQSYFLDGDKLLIETATVTPDGTSRVGGTTTYVKYTAVPIPAPPVRKVEAGFTSLFNGKDLTDWKAGAPPDTFKVENGMIVANGVGGPGHLYYDGAIGSHAFTDFDLKVDALARYRSNGGVYVMTQFQPQGFPSNGFEIQVNNSHTDRIRTGSLYHVVDLSVIPAKDDEWMPMEIIGRGQTIAISVKGQEVVHWTQPDDWQTNYDTTSRKIAPGTIAFQAHDPYSVTAYSNIRLKLLK